VRLVTPLRVSDPQCGCKLFRRQMLQHHIELLRTDGYAYEVELLIRLQAAGATLVELPIRWREGRGSKVRVIRDGVHMLRDLMRAVRMAKA
jgi:dolichyl-phosphate beta-glucosyltransferase